MKPTKTTKEIYTMSSNKEITMSKDNTMSSNKEITMSKDNSMSSNKEITMSKDDCIMTNQNVNNKETYIEKFEPTSIEHESIPFAQINRNVIQNIKNPVAAFIWIYLQSMPRTWKPNKHQIMKHFDISERTYERHMAFLRDSCLIAYRKVRYKNGRLGACAIIVLNGDKFIVNPIKNTKLRIVNSDQTAKNDGAVEKTSCLWIKSKNPNEIKGSHQTAKKPGCGDLAVYINKQRNKIKENTTTVEDEIDQKVSSSDFVISKKGDEKLLKLRNDCLQDEERTDEEYLKQCKFHVEASESNGYTHKQSLIGLEKIIREGEFKKPKGYKAGNVPKEIEENFNKAQEERVAGYWKAKEEAKKREEKAKNEREDDAKSSKMLFNRINGKNGLFSYASC